MTTAETLTTVLSEPRRRLESMLDRRSCSSLTAPGPDSAELDAILAAATTVPDHGALRPWRFVVVTGAGLDVFGEALVRAGRAGSPGALPTGVEDKLRGKAHAAPLLVVLIASPVVGHKVPEWEQVASASCAGFAMVLAAHTLGLGAVWKSAPVTDRAPVRELFGLTPSESVLGWVNIGRPAQAENRRSPAVDLGGVVTVLAGSSATPWEF